MIAIIGIVTIIASSSFVSAQKKSRDASRKASLKSLSDALNMYYADFGLFPSSITLGDELVSGNEVYMKKVPIETSKAVGQFRYQVSSTGKSFRLYANLENNDDTDCLKEGDLYYSSCLNYTDYNISSGCCYVVTSSNANTDSWP